MRTLPGLEIGAAPLDYLKVFPYRQSYCRTLSAHSVRSRMQHHCIFATYVFQLLVGKTIAMNVIAVITI
jgi:hypothetical protein